MKQGRTKTSLYIDNDLMEWLRVEAARKRCSVAYLIRILIAEAKEKAG